MMDWIKAITFDFWGTLVDVDTSGTEGMRRVLQALGVSDVDAEALYHEWDAATVRRYRSDAWQPYLHWGALALGDALAARGISVEAARAVELAELLISTMTSQAKPHPEVPAIIRELRKRYPLMPITNMDDRFFTMNPFKQEFDLFVTAQQAKAFKPSALIFLRAAEKLALEPASILHVSLAQFADLEGAMPIGMKVCWINRGREQLGKFTPKPLHEFPDLTGLATLLGV